MPINSSAEFGGVDSSQNLDTPVALGASTAGTYAQQTAWKTREMGRGRPLPYSKRSAGSTYRWDDDNSPTVPQSDKGVGKSER